MFKNPGSWLMIGLLTERFVADRFFLIAGAFAFQLPSFRATARDVVLAVSTFVAEGPVFSGPESCAGLPSAGMVHEATIP